MAVRIEGLRELRTAFAVAGVGMEKDLDAALKSAAEPVKAEAHGLAISHLKHGRIDWSEMRIGIARHSVYVAPARRRTVGPRRRKLAPKIQSEVLDPALERNVSRVKREVQDAVHDMARIWGRV